MFNGVVNYKDFDGNDHAMDLYFHLNVSEFLDIDSSIPGGLTNKIEKIQMGITNESKDLDFIHEYIDFIELLVSRSYGVKSEDGNRFMKSEEILSEFQESNAYEACIMKFANDLDFAIGFFNGIIPSALANDPKFKEAVNNTKQ